MNSSAEFGTWSEESETPLVFETIASGMRQEWSQEKRKLNGRKMYKNRKRKIVKNK